MKRQFTLSGMLMTCMVMVTVFLSSCGSKPERDNSVIPADAPIVMEINVEKLTLKSNIVNYKDQLADMLVASDEKNENVLQLADAIRKMDDGGLNFHKPVYVFTNANVDGMFILASIRSQARVDSTALKMAGGKYRIIEDEEDGLVWYEDDNHTTIGVRNDEVLLIGTAEQKEIFAQLITGEGGFFGTKMGQEMAAHAGDITLAVNAEAVNEDVMDALRERLIQSDRKTGALLESDELWDMVCKVQMVWNLKFAVGEVSMNIYSLSQETNENAQILTKVDGDVFENIPSKGLIGALVMGIDGEKLAGVLEEAVAKRGKDMDNETRMGLTMLSTLCKAMNGSAALSVSMDGVSKDPGIVALLPIAQEKIQYIFNMLTEDSDKEVYLTGSNNYSAISNIRTYQYGAVRPSLDMASHAKSCYMYGYFDIQELIRLAFAYEGKSSKLGKDEMDQAVLDYLQLFSYAEMKMMAFDELSIILKLNDDKHNSLSVLLERTFDLGLKYLQHREAQHRQIPTYDSDFELEAVEEVDWN